MWEVYEGNGKEWELIGTYDNLDSIPNIVKHEIYLHNSTPELQNQELQFKIISKF